LLTISGRRSRSPADQREQAMERLERIGGEALAEHGFQLAIEFGDAIRAQACADACAGADPPASGLV
jgi:hypothetical protein